LTVLVLSEILATVILWIIRRSTVNSFWHTESLWEFAQFRGLFFVVSLAMWFGLLALVSRLVRRDSANDECGAVNRDL